MEQDPIPNRDADFDGEEWDDRPELLAAFLKSGLSFQEWLDIMSPIWTAQIRQMREKGYLWWE